jgi:hypothetical protein
MSDFSTYTATQIAEWMSQGTIDAAPANLYVALFDDTGTEVSGDFANDRPSTAAGTDWNIINTNDFENAAEIDFGEAAVDVSNIQDVALYDDTLASGGNQIARYTLTDAPFDVSAGSRAFFEAAQLSFDVEDTSE